MAQVSMTQPTTASNTAHDAVILVARILLAYIFIKSGFGKITNLSGFTTYLTGHGVPMPSVLAVVGACVEFFGGIAVLLGLFTRYVALLMMLFVLVAALISHRYWDIADATKAAQTIQFNKNLAIMGGFLLLFATGGGRYAIDNMFARR